MMLNRTGNIKGFSLIELMITLVILTMLISTATYAYQLLTNRWQKGLTQFDLQFDLYRNQELLNNILHGLVSYVVLENDSNPAFYFIGGKDRVLGVTRNGLFNTNSPEIFRLSILQNSDQSYRLVYQSTSLEKLLLLRTEQEIEFKHSVTLFNKIDSFEFSYFGWESLAIRTSTERNTIPQWYSTYSGIDKDLMPQKMRLSLIGENIDFSLYASIDSDSFNELSSYFKDVE